MIQLRFSQFAFRFVVLWRTILSKKRLQSKTVPAQKLSALNFRRSRIQIEFSTFPRNVVYTSCVEVFGIMEKYTEGMLVAFCAKTHDGLCSWGGPNLIVAVDWLQLPPVASESIFSKPFLKVYDSPVKRICDIFLAAQ